MIAIVLSRAHHRQFQFIVSIAGVCLQRFNWYLRIGSTSRRGNVFIHVGMQAWHSAAHVVVGRSRGVGVLTLVTFYVVVRRLEHSHARVGSVPHTLPCSCKTLALDTLPSSCWTSVPYTTHYNACVEP